MFLTQEFDLCSVMVRVDVFVVLKRMVTVVVVVVVVVDITDVSNSTT